MASCAGLIISYDRVTGERVWEVDITGDGQAQSFHGEMARVDGTLLVGADPTDGHIYRIGAATGDVQWKWNSTSGANSDLLVRDGFVVAVTEDNQLTVLTLAKGNLVWQTEVVDADRIAPVTPTPLFVGDDFIFGRRDGRITRHSLLRSDPQWEIWIPGGVSTDLTAVEDGVFLGTTDGRLLKISEQGEVQQEVELGAMPTYRWFATEVGVLVGMTEVGGPDRLVVGVDSNTLQERWSFGSPDGEGWTIAQPAMGWGLVLVGNREPALYAVDPATGEVQWRAETAHPPRTASVDGEELYLGTYGGMLDAYRRASLRRDDSQ